MPSPPDPPPHGRPPPPRISVSPSLGPVPQDENGRLLTLANIQLRRGRSAEAEAAVQKILQACPDDAPALELLADIRMGRNDFEGALEALRQALRTEPGRTTAEARLARAALRRTERQSMETMGVAYAASDTALMRLGGGGRKSATWAALGSAFVPGLGQYVNGDTLKGVVLASLYFLTIVLLALLPDTRNLAGCLSSYFVPTVRAARIASTPVSGLSWFLVFVLFGDWFYAVLDAALAPSRSARPHGPSQDGWKV